VQGWAPVQAARALPNLHQLCYPLKLKNVNCESINSLAVNEEGITMRKSIIGGLTVATTVMAFAGGSHAYVSGPGCVGGDAGGGRPCIQNAYDDHASRPVIALASLKDSKSAKSAHRRRHPSQIVEAPPQSLRVPANPVVRDCTHVMFPQCSRQGGLNDGTFALPY
jgi:hypothetical protein